MASEEQIAALYAAHAPRARALAYLLTGDVGLAEDLVQDCFLRLCSKTRSVGAEEMPAYLRRMVVNAVNSHFRSLRVRRARAATAAEVLGSDRDVASDGAGQRAERDQLRRALLQLPERQRTAVVLRHWLELSEHETAAEMGCSVGTVKSLTSRGRAALRGSLAPAGALHPGQAAHPGQAHPGQAVPPARTDETTETQEWAR